MGRLAARHVEQLVELDELAALHVHVGQQEPHVSRHGALEPFVGAAAQILGPARDALASAHIRHALVDVDRGLERFLTAGALEFGLGVAVADDEVGPACKGRRHALEPEAGDVALARRGAEPPPARVVVSADAAGAAGGPLLAPEPRGACGRLAALPVRRHGAGGDAVEARLVAETGQGRGLAVDQDRHALVARAFRWL